MHLQSQVIELQWSYYVSYSSAGKHYNILNHYTRLMFYFIQWLFFFKNILNSSFSNLNDIMKYNSSICFLSRTPEEVCKNLLEQAATWIPIFPKKNFETLNQINTCLLSSVTLEQEIQHCFLLELNCAKYLHRLSGLQNFQTRSLVRGFGSSALN